MVFLILAFVMLFQSQTEGRGYLFGEFLYEQAIVDGLEYGFSEKMTADLSIPAGFVNAEVRDLDFEWSPGFRIGGGYLFPTNCNLSLNWTHLNSHAKGSYHTCDFPEKFLNAQWLSDAVGGQADKAKAKWQLNFNTLDLQLGKAFSIGNCCCLQPFFGARAAWIKQHYRVDYHSQFVYTIFNVSGGVLPFDTNVKIHQDFTAGGLKAGSDFTWNFAPQFSLWGCVSGSLLYAHYNYHMSVLSGSLVQELLHLPSPAVVPVYGKLKNHYNRLRSNFEESIGVEWCRCFGCFQVFVRLGYEFSQWIDQNDFINIMSSVDTTPFSYNGETISEISSNDIVHQGRHLMIHGLTARVEVNF